MAGCRSAAPLFLLVLLLAAGCAGTPGSGVTPSATTTAAISGWESWARLEWTAQPAAGGNDIVGYVYSHRGHTLLNVVGQKIEWIPSAVPAMQRAYFRVPAMPPAAQYPGLVPVQERQLHEEREAVHGQRRAGDREHEREPEHAA
jgi:hypothetical protein